MVIKNLESSKFIRFLLPIVILALFIQSCSLSNRIPAATATAVPTAIVPVITQPAEPFLPEPGIEGNPYILAAVSSEGIFPQVDSALSELAAFLSQETGYLFEHTVYSDYNTLVLDMQKRLVHFAWLPPVPYLAAKQNHAASAILLVNNYGVYFYGVQFFADINDGYDVYYNPDTGLSTASASTALEQFNEATPCWVSDTAISGYLVPLGLINDQEITVPPGVFTQSATAVIRSLYIKGICDFGVTYAHTGDPRTSSSLADLPDLQERIVIIWKSDPIIPTQNLSAYPDLDPRLVQQVAIILQEHAGTDEGKLQLGQILDTAVEGVKPIDDKSYEPLRHYLDSAGADIPQLLRRMTY
jgi:phosphonate transport system substrate-binding protein